MGKRTKHSFPIFICCLLFLSACINDNSKPSFADNAVVAHRGAWKNKGLPQNSIAALNHAIQLETAGSEFDVLMTADDSLVVTHGPDYHNLPVEETNYEELAAFKLSNGEKLPTLRAYIRAGMANNKTTRLVCEIKPSNISKERGKRIAAKVVQLVRTLKAEQMVTYISFDYDILKKIIELKPGARAQYLAGDKAPEQLKSDGVSGVDYHFSKFKEHPEWIESAKERDVTLNTWTVNKAADMNWLLERGFDFITTDEPELLFQQLRDSTSASDYTLVWSDEFNHTGRPDSAKWDYEHGFIRNQEKQYYTDAPENVRVKDGFLIIEARKEQKETADYTSASVTTQDRAEWKYGKIEVRAKLPKGVGLWPAIWMLGENLEEVGWPKSGEIDIMEHVGFESDSIFGTVHTQAYNHMKGTQKGKKIFIDEPYTSFHVFAIEWTPEKIDFLLDGKVYNSFKNEHKTVDEWPFDQPFHLKMNIAVGGGLGGQKGINDRIFPQQMIVDYARVYQLRQE